MDNIQPTINTLTEAQFLEQAQTYFSKEDYTLAADSIEQALNKYPNSEEFKSYLVQACIKCFELYSKRNQNLDAAIYILKALVVNPKLVDIASYININNVFFEHRDFSHSDLLIQLGLEAFPNNESLLQAQANTRMSLGQIALAILSLQKIVNLDPEKHKPTNKSHVNLSIPSKIWRIRSELGDLDWRLDLYCKSINLPVDSDVENYLIAIALAKQGLFQPAQDFLIELCGRYPECIEIHAALGLINLSWGNLSSNHTFYANAQTRFLEVIRIKPNWEVPYYFLGVVVSYISGDRNQSLQLFLRAIELNPEHEDSLKSAGETILRIQGQSPEALSYIARYLKAQKKRQDRHPIGQQGVRYLAPYNVWAMGHLGELPDAFLKLQKLGKIPDYKAIIWAPDSMVANSTLLDCWRQYFTIISDESDLISQMRLLKELEFDTAFYLHEENTACHMIVIKSYLERDWTLKGHQPLLQLSEEIKTRGWNTLAKLGIKPGSWFITAHAREGGFKNEPANGFNSHRNTNIETYEKAFEEIRNRGGWVIRIGEPSMKALKPMDKVIDYAHSELKSSWMDIFLLSQCKFYLSGTAGAYSTPFSFGVPVAFANWTPSVPLLYGSRELYIYKLLWNKELNRYLTLKEAMSAPFLYSEENTEFSKRRIEFVDNTADEIAELTVEMLDRIDGKVQYSQADENLQQAFASILPPIYGVCTTRLGREYSRKYANLISS
jgi:putative glycosyltransferase (TIGR04372 family)